MPPSISGQLDDASRFNVFSKSEGAEEEKPCEEYRIEDYNHGDEETFHFG